MENRSEHSEHDEHAIVSQHPKVVSARRGAVERRMVRAFGSTLEHASWERCRRLGATLGLVFFVAGRRKRALAIANVQMALGVNRARAMRIARRSAQNWGMTSLEFMHLPGASPQEIHNYCQLDGLEHLQAALAGGAGAIIITAHFGNWEVLLARLAQECPMTAIVRPLSNVAVTEHMTNVRRGTGVAVISKHAAARPALKVLHSGGPLYILPDRHAGPPGAPLPMFGRVTRFDTAPARLAMMTGAPIVPVFGVRREPWLADGRVEGRILPPFTVQAAARDQREAATLDGTRQIIACIETMVRERPEQWSWMLRRWRDDDAAVPGG